MRDGSMQSRMELAQEFILLHGVVQPNCTEKTFKLLVLKLFLVPKLCSEVHCMLDPEPCLVDLVYLTSSVGFVLTLTPCGNKDLIWYDVILSVLKLG